MNNIIELLHLTDPDMFVTGVEKENLLNTIYVEKELKEYFCPCCFKRMWSKGAKVRTVNHPLLQDGSRTIIKVKQRRFECSDCKISIAEHFSFVDKGKRSSKSVDFLILDSIKDITLSFKAIGRKFNVSDTYVNDVFKKYVDMKRLPLSSAICFDEVFTDCVKYSKYSMVILDFHKGEPIDILPSRQKRDTNPYFLSIPMKERAKVKYIVTDMYQQYFDIAEQYFPNAVCAIDSYHVVQWLTKRITKILADELSTSRKKDKERAEYYHRKGFIKISHRTYLLQRCRWIVLKNTENIDYSRAPKRDRHFGFHMSTYDYEDKFFTEFPIMKEVRRLKEKYIQFNKKNVGNPEAARIELSELIHEYANSEIRMFNDFARLLKTHFEAIINSFVMVQKLTSTGDIRDTRLSSGSIESFNRKPKDLIRNGRGYSNFENIRNRLLFAGRHNPSILGIPRL